MRPVGKLLFWITMIFASIWLGPGDCRSSLAPHAVEGGVLFSYCPLNPVRSVHLAGEFNDWDVNTAPMFDEDGDGIWTVVLALPPGRWEYKFVVDGNMWVTDPHAQDVNYGNFNNGVVYVGQEPPAGAQLRHSDVPWADDLELAPHPVEGGMLFSYRAPKGTRSAYLAGEFNGWSTAATPMSDDDSDGLWRTWYPLKPGRKYEYKFVVDGQWITDPNAPQTNAANYNNGVVYAAELYVPYAVMTFPTDGSRPQDIRPISGQLRCHGDETDSASIEVRLGEKILPYSYESQTGYFSAPLPQDLPDLDYQLMISARGISSGKTGHSRIYFTMDREPAVFDSPDFFDRAVIYEIFVRSFKDSDGDSIGDLNGVTHMLDYLNDGDPKTDMDLGVSTIWLMPVCQSPSYHGYDVTDYLTIEEDYGTNDDFFRLCREAHRRGIRVLFDLVINHCSSQHPFFQDALGNKDSPYSGWFKFSDPEQTEYESFFGYKGMPELNFDSRELREYLLHMATYWMDPNGDGDYSDGVDGFRCDVAKGPPHDWWKELRREMKKMRSDFLLLGEVWDNVEIIYGYFDYEFDMQFDYPLYYELLKFVNGGNKSELRSVLKQEKIRFPVQAQLCRFLDNHDNDRILSSLAHDMERNKLAALLLLTLPGTPMIYYGQEVGMTGTNPPDEAIRASMEWGRVNRQQNDEKSLFNWYRHLVHLRSTYPALTARDDQDQTSYRNLMTTNLDVYAYLRSAPDAESFLVMINSAAEPVEEYKIFINASTLKPGQYEVQDMLCTTPEQECAPLQVGPKGRIMSYRPLLQLAPKSGYLLKLKPVQDKLTH